MCTNLVHERNASTLSQLANEMVHHLHLNEYGNLSSLPDLDPDSHSDQIQLQFGKCDDDDELCWQHLHLFQHQPQHLEKRLHDKEDELNPRQCQTERQKCTVSIRLFHERHMQNPAVWQQHCPNPCLCKTHNQSTHLGLPSNCALLAVTSLQPPCAVQRPDLLATWKTRCFQVAYNFGVPDSHNS